jgi:hypothetical protein
VPEESNGEEGLWICEVRANTADSRLMPTPLLLEVEVEVVFGRSRKRKLTSTVEFSQLKCTAPLDTPATYTRSGLIPIA